MCRQMGNGSRSKLSQCMQSGGHKVLGRIIFQKLFTQFSNLKPTII